MINHLFDKKEQISIVEQEIKVNQGNIITTNINTTKTTKVAKKVSKTTIKVNKENIINELHKQIIQRGWSEKDYEAVLNIVQKESNFNPNSVNKKSGACGLFQAYPCSKAVKKYKDYKSNYISQIKWGLDYIQARYNNPASAWLFWQNHKWY